MTPKESLFLLNQASLRVKVTFSELQERMK